MILALSGRKAILIVYSIFFIRKFEVSGSCLYSRKSRCFEPPERIYDFKILLEILFSAAYVNIALKFFVPK